jgi:hypothetical protein
MNADLRDFLERRAGTVAMTPVPVKIIAFVSMPLSLGHHTGEPLLDANAPPAHMT